MDAEEKRKIAEDKLEQINLLVEDYFKFSMEELDTLDTYVASWAIVANIGRYASDSGMALGYGIESYPVHLSPHAVKGLFFEGVDCVETFQRGLNDE